MLSTAVVLERFQAPVILCRFPVPEPGPGGAIVRVAHGGVCGTDLHLQHGRLDIPVPIVLGHEGLGTVAAIGPGGVQDVNGDDLAVGDVVMWASSISCGRCVACTRHREPTLCRRRRTYGVNRPVTEEPALSGAWSEFIYLRRGTAILRLPSEIDPLAAMSLACAGPTVVHALSERRPVRVGEVVIVQGSGPVGLAAAALCQLAGAASVVIVGGPRSRLELAADCGFGDRHVNIVDAEDADEALTLARRATPSGAGADLVIECAGTPVAVAQGLTLARRGGAYLVLGQYTDNGVGPINPHQIVYRQLDVMGSWAFTGVHLAQYVGLLPALARRYDLRRLVTTFPLTDTQAALDQVQAGAVMKAVLTT